MKYRFSDIYSDDIDMSKVLFVTGQYAIFNNIVIDRLRSISYGERIEVDMDLLQSIASEFPGSGDIQSDLLSNTVSSIDEFLVLVKTPPINGRWFCSTDIKQLTKAQMKKVTEYYKKPSDNGILVIYSTEWKDYRGLLRDRVLNSSNKAHIIQLSFPYRKILADVVRDIFSMRDKKISENAINLFIMRMSSAYDEYSATIDNICDKVPGELITYMDMKDALKGVENYVIDDFVNKLLIPMGSKKVCKTRKIYKMIRSLSEDIGYSALLNKLAYKIDDYLEMRIAINRGIVPTSLRYGVRQVQEKLGTSSRLSKLNEYSFRKCVYIASRTSLKDWYYMKVILLTAKNSSDSHSEYIALRAILTLVHRSVLSTNRIINDMGIINVVDEALAGLNQVFYNPYIKMLSMEEKEKIVLATRKRTETKRIPEINRNSDIEAIKLRELLKQNRIG